MTFPAFLTLGVAAAFAWILLTDDDRPSLKNERIISRVELIDGTLAGLAAGMLSARLVYVILHWPAFAAEPQDILTIWKGGMIGWAGLAGAPVGLALYCWASGVPFYRMADALSLPASMVAFSGWLGCLQDGCAYGRVANGVMLAVSAPDWTGVVRQRWPTQAIGALGAVAGIGWSTLRRRRELRPGHTAAVILVILAAGGLLAGLFRADPAATIGGIRHDLVGNGLLLIGGLALTIWRSHTTEEAE